MKLRKKSPKSAGTSPIVFTKVELADHLSEDILVSTNQAVIRVIGRDEPTPTTPEPTPTPDPSLLTPTPVVDAPTPSAPPEEDPLAILPLSPSGGPADGEAGAQETVDSVGRQDDGTAPDGASAGAGRPADRLAIAGQGTLQDAGHGWVWYAAPGLATLGVALLAAGLAGYKVSAGQSNRRKGTY